ncbi:Transmembrane protein [Plantibacter sp. RU18]
MFIFQTSVPALWLLIAVIGASIHSSRSTMLTRLEVWQRWWAAAALGCGSAWMTVSFLLIPGVMTTAIGFQETPFVTEIAFANLGLAIGGFRAIHAGRRERITIALMAGMFLWGATIGHLYQSFAHGNWAPGNTGGVLLYDLVIPAVMLVLALLSRPALASAVEGSDHVQPAELRAR